MAGSGITVTVYSGSFPDSTQRGRVEEMDNVARAFRYAGWENLGPAALAVRDQRDDSQDTSRAGVDGSAGVIP